MATNNVHFNRILCAVTFSASSRRVVGWAASLAQLDEGEVRLFHAMRPSNGFTAEGEADTERLIRKLYTLGDGLRGRPRISIAVTEGDAATEILRHARLVDADIIAVGMHARDGSVSPIVARLAIAAPCPVLAVDETEPHSPLTRGARNHFVTAVDFQPASLAAAEYAFALAQRRDAQVTTVHVTREHCEAPQPSDANLEDSRYLIDQHFRQLLQTAVTDVSPPSHSHRKVVATGHPCVEIVRVANTRDADLIIMGIDSRSPHEEFGETTSCVMQFARRSVLLVPEQLFRTPRLGVRESRDRTH